MHQMDGLYLLCLVVPVAFAIAAQAAKAFAALLFGRNTLPRKRLKWEKVPDFHLHTPLVSQPEPSPISPAARRYPGRVRTAMPTRTAAVT